MLRVPRNTFLCRICLGTFRGENPRFRALLSRICEAGALRSLNPPKNAVYETPERSRVTPAGFTTLENELFFYLRFVWTFRAQKRKKRKEKRRSPYLTVSKDPKT